VRVDFVVFSVARFVLGVQDVRPQGPALKLRGGGCNATGANCEDWVLDGPASGEKGSKGRSWLDCIRGKGAWQADAVDATPPLALSDQILARHYPRILV